MAKARRNVKTHPKVRDEEDTTTFVDPSREDQTMGSPDAGRVEVVDVFGKEEVINTGAVDLDSAAEGDARTMAQEDGGDADGDGSRSGDRGGQVRRGADVAGRGRGAPGARGNGESRGGRGDDGGSYSERVRKRIGRERALVNRERALREAVQKELGEERAARQTLTERLDRIERAQTEVAGNADVKALQAQIDALIPQIAAATEAGNTQQALTLQIKLGDLQGDLKLLKYDLAQKARTAASTTTQRQPTQQRTDTSSEVDPEAAASAEAFKRANRHWWNRSANKDAREDAITIDVEVLGEIRAGDLDFEPYTDEHWEEVARRLHQAYPNLELQDLDGVAYEFGEEDEDVDQRGNGRQGNGRDQRGNGGRSPTGATMQNGRRNQSEVDMARRGQVTLDESDFNTMRTFKMDPNNPQDKKYFAKEKLRSILTGQRTAGGNR